MGKSPEAKRLVIWVAEKWRQHEKILEWEAKGHSIFTLESVATYGTLHDNAAYLPHLILSEAAWNWNDSMWPMAETAMKSARKEKAGKKGGK